MTITHVQPDIAFAPAAQQVYKEDVSNRDAGTYLYVKDGAEPRSASVLPERVLLKLDPPRPAEPISRVRLVRPTLHAQRCDPHLSMLHCPDSAQADAVRAAAAPLAEIDGPLVITGTAGAPRARMAVELTAALVETGGFAAIIDAGASVAPSLGIDRFDGLLSQFEQRTRDPGRPLELLYITWRCGLLPLELDRKASFEAVEAACEAAALGCTRCVIVAPPVDDPSFRLFASLGTVVLIATPADLASGRLASAIASAAGAKVAGVIITHLEAAAPAASAHDEPAQAESLDATAEPAALDAGVDPGAAGDAQLDAPADAQLDAPADAQLDAPADDQLESASIAAHPLVNDDDVDAPSESTEKAN
ncbi:MAG: hypothetical protein ACI9U2_000897 [Bradymonadia bacterium]|jgi:hypothetical protein